MKPMTPKYLFLMLSLVFIVCLTASAQETAGDGRVPVQRLVSAPRRVHAQSYTRIQETTVDFAGTALMPKARGSAKVETAKGGVRVAMHVEGLGPASQVDPTCLTYVLWAIPTGQRKPQNLGELALNGGESKLTSITILPTFAMIVTAEPYFAVEQPSTFLVLQNVLHNNSEDSDFVRADLLPLRMDSKTPLDIYEARNAVRIARLAGAERYAAEPFHKALQLLQQAESIFARNKKGGEILDVKAKAREATEAAEQAREAAAAVARNHQTESAQAVNSTP
jgi:hypothetical protein